MTPRVKGGLKKGKSGKDRARKKSKRMNLLFNKPRTSQVKQSQNRGGSGKNGTGPYSEKKGDTGRKTRSQRGVGEKKGTSGWSCDSIITHKGKRKRETRALTSVLCEKVKKEAERRSTVQSKAEENKKEKGRSS